MKIKYAAVKKKTGRKGMDLWHILVLAVVRNGRGSNRDSLALDANSLVRKVMGVHGTEFLGEEGEQFPYQSIVDNVKLIDEALLQQINQLVVDAGHHLVSRVDKGISAQASHGTVRDSLPSYGSCYLILF